MKKNLVLFFTAMIILVTGWFLLNRLPKSKPLAERDYFCTVCLDSRLLQTRNFANFRPLSRTKDTEDTFLLLPSELNLIEKTQMIRILHYFVELSRKEQKYKVFGDLFKNYGKNRSQIKIRLIYQAFSDNKGKLRWARTSQLPLDFFAAGHLSPIEEIDTVRGILSLNIFQTLKDSILTLGHQLFLMFDDFDYSHMAEVNRKIMRSFRGFLFEIKLYNALTDIFKEQPVSGYRRKYFAHFSEAIKKEQYSDLFEWVVEQTFPTKSATAQTMMTSTQTYWRLMKKNKKSFYWEALPKPTELLSPTSPYETLSKSVLSPFTAQSETPLKINANDFFKTNSSFEALFIGIHYSNLSPFSIILMDTDSVSLKNAQIKSKMWLNLNTQYSTETVNPEIPSRANLIRNFLQRDNWAATKLDTISSSLSSESFSMGF